MSLKTFVKIGSISSLSDARYCAGMMVDILGFNLEQGTNGYVSPETFQEITEWVAGVSFAGEFASAQTAEIKLAASNYKLDYLEIQNIDQIEELSELPQKLIFRLIISGKNDLDSLKTKVSYASELVDLIIVACLEPSLSEDLYQILNEVSKDTKLIRSYGLSEASADAVASDDVFYGIELEGSPEEKPGFKDYGAVMDILEVLEED